VGSAEREYQYRPRWTTVVFCAVVFGLGAVVLGWKAATNDRGLIINPVIRLGPDGATAFYWALAALGGGFVAVAGLLVYHRVTFRQRLVFGPSALIGPASRWSRQQTEIAYRDIPGLSETAVSGQQFVHVRHAGGKDTITASMLPSKAAYAEVCEPLAALVRGAHSVESSQAPAVGIT
jgi:hypothetical protein